MMERILTVKVIGTAWMPPGSPLARSIQLSEQDVRGILHYGHGVVDRFGLLRWLEAHAGDFSSVDDFTAHIGEDFIPWGDGSSAVAFEECHA